MVLLATPFPNPLEQVNATLWTFVPFLLAIAAVILVLTYIRFRWLPKWKGGLGEWAVNRALLDQLDPLHYHVLADLLLPDGHGELTQIDHVVVSPFGVFVIETKNWDCWIFGTEKDRQWTLKYRRGRKVATQNPLHQNAKHVRVICEWLQIKPEHCHNLVFINPVSTLKTGPVAGVFLRGMPGHILSFNVPVFHPDWPTQARDVLKAASKSNDKAARAEHLEYVKSIRERRHA
jgi:hypothetical protein